jgi:hypothetical protein
MLVTEMARRVCVHATVVPRFIGTYQRDEAYIRRRHG